MSIHSSHSESRLRRLQARARTDLAAVDPGEVIRTELDPTNSLNALPGARRAAQARVQGQLAPEEYFTQRALLHEHGRVEEARETVNSRLRSKEEFPQG